MRRILYVLLCGTAFVCLWLALKTKTGNSPLVRTDAMVANLRAVPEIAPEPIGPRSEPVPVPVPAPDTAPEPSGHRLKHAQASQWRPRRDLTPMAAACFPMFMSKAKHHLYLLPKAERKRVVLNSTEETIGQVTGDAKEGGFTLTSCNNVHVMDWGLAVAIGHLLMPQYRTSIMEWGAGCGCYTSFFKFLGFEATGYDGTRNIASLTNGLVQYADLTLPQAFKPVRWVICLEVAEHIPRQFESVLIHNIVDHALEGVVISWSNIRKNPLHHNCYDKETVIQKFQKLGFKHDLRASRQLIGGVARIPDGREPGGCCPWFRESLMVFRRTPAPEGALWGEP